MQKLGIALLIATAAFTSGCLKKDLTPEEKAAVEILRTELAASQEDLSDAKEKDAALSGGLVKALVAVRVEVLSTNTALLQQRINALESGSPVEQVTKISAADPELAKQLESEISESRKDLNEAKIEALSYGGLVGAMKAASVATKEQTLAMLQQRYLSAKYGLNAPDTKPAGGVQAAATAAPAASAEPNPQIPPGSGPFGLEAGLSLDVIEKMTGAPLTLSDETQRLYMLTTPPKQNDVFETYAVVISPTVGLCQIRAIGKTINTNNYGHQLQTAFSSLQESLTKVYGKPKVIDLLMYGSIWDESRDWMMALNKKDRSLMAEWNTTAAAPLKSDVQSVTMLARAANTDSGYLFVQYSFTNQPTCTAEEERRSTGSL